MRLAPPRGLAALCTVHCSTCVAQVIAGMMILTSSPPSSGLSPAVTFRVPNLMMATKIKGCALLVDLTQHLTTRADDNHAPPVTLLPEGEASSLVFRGCQDTGGSSSRCFELNHMLHRLCGPPSIPLSFSLAAVLPRRVLNALTSALKGETL